MLTPEQRPIHELKELVVNEKQETFKPTLEYVTIINGCKVIVDVWNFRPKDGKPIKEMHPADVNFFFDGFAQTGDVTKLKVAMIDEAKKEGGILIAPRLPAIPPQLDKNSPKGIKIDPNIDARIMLKAINNQEFRTLIDFEFDFYSNDIEITGFSDGNRNALEFAGLIEKLYRNISKSTHRQLNLWSTVGVVDLVDEPKEAKGNVFLKSFLDELVSMTTEETRIRFNQEVLKNNGVNFLTKHGFNIIPAGAGSKEVAKEILKLFKSKEGIKLFAKQFKDASTKDIVFIHQLTDRALTASSPADFLKQMAKNEIRSDVCNHLETWDVRLSFPRNDKIIKPDRLGRQLKILTLLYGISIDLPLEMLSFNDQQLGEWFLTGRREGESTPLFSNQPAGKILFPRARSIEVYLVGNEISSGGRKSTSLISTHLGPMTNPNLFKIYNDI